MEQNKKSKKPEIKTADKVIEKFEITGVIQWAPDQPREYNGETQVGLKINNEFFNYHNSAENLTKLLETDFIKGNEISFNKSLNVITNYKIKKQAQNSSSEIGGETNRNNLKINKKFIVKVNGKEFITYSGLIEYAKQSGGIEKKEILQLDVSEDWKSAMARVSITMHDGRVFEDVGTCTPANSKNVTTYPQEMAVTRAYARAIRTGLGVDYCSKEEVS